MITRASTRHQFLKTGLACLFATVTAGTAVAESTPAKRPDPGRFEKDIAKFDNQFKETPTTGGIVFTGSSSIRLWKLEQDFPDLPVLNRGFGGSVANDLIVHFDRVVGRYQPRLLVVYTGSNDLNARLSPAEALADYTRFLDMVHEKLPSCRIIVNPVKVSESRIKQIPAVNELNTRLKSWIAEKSWIRWVESGDYLVDENGRPKPEYFRKDKLHLNDAGYVRWKAILEPVLKEEWARVKAS